MKKIYLPVFLSHRLMSLGLIWILSIAFVAKGQTLIESFDAVSTDSTYATLLEPGSTAAFSEVTSDKVEGAASLKFHANLASVHTWGTYVQRQKVYPEGTFLDLSKNDSLSLWIKVTMAPELPASFVFRIHIADRPAPGDNNEEYIYEHGTIIDAVSEWVQLKIPLVEREVDSGNPDTTGFILFPAAWSRNPATQENNKVLDYDKIVAFNIAAVSLTDAVDSVEFLLDKFERTGVREVPLVVFNGKAVPGNLEMWTWGQSQGSIEEGAGSTPQKNAVKWVQGDEWSNGWTGLAWNIVPPHSLVNAWSTDSLKFKLKSESWSDTLRIQLETSGTQKSMFLLVPPGDNQWHEYGFPLNSAIKVNESAVTDLADPSNLTLFQFVTGDWVGSGVAGSVLWFDDIWTGNPDIDVEASVAPTNLAIIPGAYVNLVTWSDVPGEDGESYNIYYSMNPITDVAQAEVAALRIEEGEQLFTHVLRSPVNDLEVVYYYAITCTDDNGNISDHASLGSPVTNTAQGVVTISLNAPTSTFTADGNLSEWAGITPIHMAPSGGGYSVELMEQFSGDADLSVDAYVAVDNDYLYIAFDVEDDIIYNLHSTTYENDCPDIMIGLYNWHGMPHTSFQRDPAPDYHIRFAWDRALIERPAEDSLLIPGTEYFWGEKFPTGYTVEARIPWQLIADRTGDNRFTPVEGYRIPLDFSINDADENNARQSVLTYSPVNQNNSWNNVSLWLYTWIGNTMLGADDENVALLNKYTLSQNYPNPFNPTTQIIYSLEKPGLVTIKVYDILGRFITTLVNEQQNSGQHTIDFNASDLSSGIYFYQLNSGSFLSSRKMILMK